LDFKLWDIGTVTVSDFSIEMKISEEMWLKYLKEQEVNKGEVL
jgi:uncharacterized protein YehS (DUF1456 family)